MPKNSLRSHARFRLAVADFQSLMMSAGEEPVKSRAFGDVWLVEAYIFLAVSRLEESVLNHEPEGVIALTPEEVEIVVGWPFPVPLLETLIRAGLVTRETTPGGSGERFRWRGWSHHRPEYVARAAREKAAERYLQLLRMC